MSIFSSIATLAKEVYTDVKNTYFVTPITAVGEPKAKTQVNLGNVAAATGFSLSSAPAIADLTASGASKVASSAGNLVKNAYTSASATTKLGLTAVAAFTGIAATKSPKLANQLINAPSSAVNFAQNVGTLYENPSLSTAKNVFNENPLLTSIVGLGTVGLVGYGTSTLVSNALNTAAVKKNTAVSSQWTESLNNAVNQGLSGTNSIETNKTDLKIADLNAESQLDLLKEQGKQNQQAFENQLALLKAQPIQTSPIAATPIAATPIKKATTKKKAKKKTVKKKAKKKTTKKKAKKKITKKKPKTIKRKTSKR